MPLITVTDLSIRFRGPALLDGVSCQIGERERIALVGRNGSGKTTFMRMLAGELEPDSGQIVFAPGVQVSLLPQAVPRDLVGTLREVVAGGLPPACDVEQSGWQGERQLERIVGE